MVKKKKVEQNDGLAACACGSTSFIEEGLANYKEDVTISGNTVNGSGPELDIISSTIKCVQCGKEYNF